MPARRSRCGICSHRPEAGLKRAQLHAALPRLAASGAYLAGDWGTSNLRLSLVDSASGDVIGTRHGPGIGRIDRSGIPAVIDQLASDWAVEGPLPTVLCGMVGSNIGWRDAGYVDCPAPPSAIAAGGAGVSTAHVEALILPGLRCTNPLGAPDHMRGEETQILGAMVRRPRLRSGRRMMCLPGTHNKWARVDDGAVVGFATGFSGELFAVLAENSALTRGASGPAHDPAAFSAGVARVIDHADADLVHLLFETRGQQIAGRLTPDSATSFLSGLIVGRDIQGAMRMFAELSDASGITIIGAGPLAQLYAAASRQLGFHCNQLDGDDLSRAGIHALVSGKFCE